MTRMLAAACLCCMAAACDHVDEVTPQKYVGLVVGHAAPLKIEIAKSLMANPGKPVPQAGVLRLPAPAGVAPMRFDFGWVTTGGAIVVHDHKYAVVLVQEPVVTDREIRWNCVVHPAEARPKLCGSDYENSTLKVK
jgi:hypothetical protein